MRNAFQTRGVRQQLVGLTTALILLPVLASCSKDADSVSGETAIRLALPQIPASIGNPYQGITLPGTLPLQAVFDTLTLIDKDGNPEANLAIAWKQEAPKAWIFSLRPGILFSNGEVFDADAVVASANHLTSAEGRGESIGSNLKQIKGAERIDDLTVRILLSEEDPMLPHHVSIWRIPAPKQWETLTTTASRSTAVGTGPFVVESRDDSQMTLAANPNAWRKAEAKRIQLLVIPEPTARLQAFSSGAVDVALVLANDAEAAVTTRGGTLHTRLTPLVDYAAFNTERRKTPLHDPRVRRALNMAVNRAALAETILGGATKPAAQLAYAGAFGFDPSLAPIPYDPEGARKLLAEAGYPNGLKLQMTVTSGEVSGDTLYYQQIGSDLKKIGVDVTIIGRPSSRQMQDVFTGNLKSEIFSWSARGADPLMDFRHRSCVAPSPTRMPHHCDPKLTALIRTALAETDLDKRRALYMDIAAYEQQYPPGIMLWQRPEFDAVASNISGYDPDRDYFHLDKLVRTVK